MSRSPKRDHPGERAARVAAIKESPSYRQAHIDPDFMRRVELRPVRLQIELLKPELTLAEHDIHSTIVVFGGTRIPERGDAQALVATAQQALAQSPHDAALQRSLKIAERLLAKCHYYDEARRFAQLVSTEGGSQEYVVCTGGGPGIMEAANRGAFDVKAKSIGLNITLPFEQEPNSYISPELCFEFKYFAIRKMHFLMRAKAMVAFPGGYGTMDELFETLTLIQTKRMDRIPIILFGKDYWDQLVHWEVFVDEGTISPEDLDLLWYAESAREAWDLIRDFYRDKPQPVLPRGQ
jgi:hypothetical protein